MSRPVAARLPRRGPQPTVPDEVLIASYGKYRSVQQVGAEVGLNFAVVASRLNTLGVEMRDNGRRGKPARRDGLPLEYPEKRFTQAVVDLARALGWRVYHTWWSEHSAAGFPDLVLVRKGRLVFAELKVKAVVKAAQREWLKALGEVPGVEVYLWRYPQDWPQIEQVLR